MDAVHGQRGRQHLSGLRVFTAGLVGAVAGSDGDGERVEAGFLHEIFGLVRVGEVVLHLAVGQSGAVAVFDAAQDAQLTLDRDAQGMGHFDGRPGDLDVLFVGVGSLAVFPERAVHHDGGESEVDGGLEGLEAVAVVQVHGHGNVRVFLAGSFHELLEVDEAAVLQGAAARLDNHRAVGFVGRLHDGLDLLHVVDVERAHTVSALRGLIQNLTHWNEWHGTVLLSRLTVALKSMA